MTANALRKALPGFGRPNIHRLVPGAKLVTWACFGIIAAWMMSLWVFKIWYIATALAAVAVAWSVTFGMVTLRGLPSAITPVLCYFAYLALTWIWSADPHTTLWWVSADSVEILVFAIFFAWSRSVDTRTAMRFFSFLLVAEVCSAAYWAMTGSGEADRFGGIGVFVLPVILPFQWISLRASSRPNLVRLAIALALMIAAISRSRTPTMAEFLSFGLCCLVFSENVVALLRNVLVAVLAVVALIGVLLVIPTTRELMHDAYLRFTGQTVTYSRREIVEQDFERHQINDGFRELLPQYFPRGMGYESFLGWYEMRHGYPVALHDMYETWLLEGGLACVAIVIVLFGRPMLLLNRLRRSPERIDADFAKACGIATVALSAMGAFHQVHQMPILWMMLGTIHGFAARKALRRAPFRPRKRRPAPSRLEQCAES